MRDSVKIAILGGAFGVVSLLFFIRSFQLFMVGDFHNAIIGLIDGILSCVIARIIFVLFFSRRKEIQKNEAE
jgi:hypothetical protein